MISFPATIEVRTHFGLNEQLAAELKELGADNPQPVIGGFTIEADEALLFRCLLRLRTATRIFYVLGRHQLESEDDFEKAAKNYDWHEIIGMTAGFNVGFWSNHQSIGSETDLGKELKSLITSHYETRFQITPPTTEHGEGMFLFCQVDDFGQCSFYLDAAGGSLSQRGYSYEGFKPHIDPCVAAGVLMASGWVRTRSFIDPFCAGGTILAEAALIAKQKAPGLLRDRFDVQNWPLFRRVFWQTEMKQALAREYRDVNWIYGSDAFPKEIERTRKLMKNAHLQRVVKLRVCRPDDIFLPKPAGVIVTALPKAKEEKGREMIRTKAEGMVQHAAKFGAGYKAFLISTEPEMKESLEMKPQSVREITVNEQVHEVWEFDFT